MPLTTTDRQAGSARSRLITPIAIALSAFFFVVLLLLVRARWSPLERLDHAVAAHLNAAVADHPAIVGVLRAITWTGSTGVLWTLIVVASLILAIRHRYRLALYLVVTGAGALTLDPILKTIVGRLRPVVSDPIAYGTGNSFPSGHALGSIVCYGALFLVFVPALRGRPRSSAAAAVVALVVAIGTSRVLLGVHYLSDVVGAWLLGVAWLGLTAYAFEVLRHGSGRRVTQPLSEGLEPEAAEDLRLTESTSVRHPFRIAAALVIAWTLVLGVVTGLGELVTHHTNGGILGDRAIPRWFAEHRTPPLTTIGAWISTGGATQAILIVSVLTCVIAVAATRRWRPAVFVAVLMFGELGLFLVSESIVKRPRPEVSHLDAHLPTSSYPSGHVAATLCVYAAIALLVAGHTRRWWRMVFLVLAILMPLLVATSRMYRGMHHPTDVLGSILLGVLWIGATYRIMRPVETGSAAVRSRGETGSTASDHDPIKIVTSDARTDGIVTSDEPISSVEPRRRR